MYRIRLFTHRSILLFASISVLMTTGASFFVPDIPVGTFSSSPVEAGIPEEWEEITFSKTDPTEYRLVDYDGRTVVQAVSEGTASGLIREVDIDPEMYPMLHWEWKINKVLSKGDVTSKKGDDFSARIYITFEYNASNLPFGERVKYKTLRLLGYKDIPLRAINYVWSNKAPVDTIVPNAYTDWVSMIAVQSGNEKANTWQSQQRDIFEDYVDAFGEHPGDITGIAIMTDTDNTNESATAYFGDITVHQRF